MARKLPQAIKDAIILARSQMKLHFTPDIKKKGFNGQAYGGVITSGGVHPIVKLKHNAPCHGFVGSSDFYSGKRDYVVSFVRTPHQAALHNLLPSSYQEAVKFYYNWLVKDSPWAKLFIYTSPSNYMKYGLIVSGEHSGNHCLQAMIASRYPSSWPGTVTAMHEFSKAGLNPSVAFWLAHIVSLKAEPDGKFRVYDGLGATNHYAKTFNVLRIGDEALKAFVEGELPNGNAPLNQRIDYTASGGVFGVYYKEGVDSLPRILSSLIFAGSSSLGITHSDRDWVVVYTASSEAVRRIASCFRGCGTNDKSLREAIEELRLSVRGESNGHQIDQEVA